MSSAPHELESDVASSGSREARLDLLLAEELQVNRPFAAWFVGRAFDTPVAMTFAGRDPVVRFNVWDEGGPPLLERSQAGENDLDVVFHLTGGSKVRLLIEDKVWAPFQPEQARRYRARAESREATAAVLVAPRRRLEATADENRHFHEIIAVEDIARVIEEQAAQCAGSEPELSRRLRWRANLLKDLCVPTSYAPGPDHAPTLEFREFCVAWLAREAPEVIPSDSMRTKGSGWLGFAQPRGLTYKLMNGCVDLDVARHGFAGMLGDLQSLVAEGTGPDEFIAATAGTQVVLRWVGRTIRPELGLPDDREAVIDGLEACVRAARWIASRPSFLTPM